MTCYLFFFFFNDTATTEIYTLSLHDALPISVLGGERPAHQGVERPVEGLRGRGGEKPDPAEVDAEDGGVAAVQGAGAAQQRAVAAERDQAIEPGRARQQRRGRLRPEGRDALFGEQRETEARRDLRQMRQQ